MNIVERARQAGTVARYSAHVAWERRRLPTYRTPRQIPHAAEAITPEWLSAVLCGDVPAARVNSVSTTGGSDGNSSRRALHVEYNAAGQAAVLPARLFTKASTDVRSRITLVSSGKVENEIGFHLRVRPGLDIEAPTAISARAAAGAVARCSSWTTWLLAGPSFATLSSTSTVPAPSRWWTRWPLTRPHVGAAVLV